MNTLNDFFEAVERDTQGNTAEFWQQLSPEDKEQWLQVIKDSPLFEGLEIGLDLVTNSPKEFGFLEGDLPQRDNLQLGATCKITYTDIDNYIPCFATLTLKAEGWNITLNGIDYLVHKEENNANLTYIPNVLKILEQEYSKNKDKDIHRYLQEKNIAKLVDVISNDIKLIDSLSQIEMVELFLLTDASSKQFLYQFALKTKSEKDLECLVDRAQSLLPPVAYNQLISYQEKGQNTLLNTVSKKFPDFDAKKLRKKLTPVQIESSEKQSSVTVASSVDTHSTSVNMSADLSLLNVFERFAKDYHVGSDNFIILRKSDKRCIELTQGGRNLLKEHVQRLLSELEKQINALLLQKPQDILKLLNGEQGSELFQDQDVQTFKKNLAVAKRFVEPMRKGHPFGWHVNELKPTPVNLIGLSLQEILAITYWATKDTRSPNNTRNLLNYVKHIKEIMREYSNEEYSGEDRNKCLSGTVNHLVKALSGIAPDVTVAFVTEEEIGAEINDLWHKFLIKKMQETPDLCEFLLNNEVNRYLIEHFFQEFSSEALSFMKENYQHILLDQNLLRALQNPASLAQKIRMGVTRDKGLMRQFNAFFNDSDFLQKINLKTYLELLKQNKAPYYFYHPEKGMVSIIESIIKAKNLLPKDILICFDQLPERFHLILLRSFMHCFDKKDLAIALLEAKKFKLLRVFDPNLEITQAALEYNTIENHTVSLAACISQDEYKLFDVLVKSLKEDDLCKEVLVLSGKNYEIKRYLLFVAFDKGNPLFIKALLEKKAHIFLFNQAPETFFHCYFKLGGNKYISPEELYQNGVSKQKLVEEALSFGDLNMVRQLDAPVFNETKKWIHLHNSSLFNLALQQGDIELASILVQKTYVNTPYETRYETIRHNRQGEYDPEPDYYEERVTHIIKYPIHRAIELKDVGLIHALIEAGASSNLLTDGDQSVLDLALSVGLNPSEAFPPAFLKEIICDLIKKEQYSKLIQLDPECKFFIDLLKQGKIDSLSLYQKLFTQGITDTGYMLAQVILKHANNQRELVNTPVSIPHWYVSGKKSYENSLLLFLAIDGKQVELVDLMLTLGAKVLVKDGFNTFSAEQQLKKHKPDPKMQQIRELFKKHQVRAKGLELALEQKIYSYFDEEEQLDFLMERITPSFDDLMDAVSQSSWKVVERFIHSMDQKTQIDLHVEQTRKITKAIIELSKSKTKMNKVAMIEYFLDRGIEVNESFIRNFLREGNPSLIKVIIQHHNGCVKTNRSLREALYFDLIENNDVDALIYLRDLAGDSLLPRFKLSLDKLNPQMIDYLFTTNYLKFQKKGQYSIGIESSKPIGDCSTLFIVNAIKSNNLDVLKSLCKHGLDVYNFKHKGQTLLMHMAQLTSGSCEKYKAVFKEIIERSSSSSFSLFNPPPYLDLKDGKGLSALDHAVTSGNILAIKLLLDHGATLSEELEKQMNKKGISREVLDNVGVDHEMPNQNFKAVTQSRSQLS